MKDVLQTGIEYLKGVGSVKADLLKKELNLHTFFDLLYTFPFRYVDKTKFTKINELHAESGEVQLRGILRRKNTYGEGRKKRLTAAVRDETGAVELVWFKGVFFVNKTLEVGREYVIYGKVNAFNDRISIPHPEIEPVGEANTAAAPTFEPVYPSTDKLNQKGLDARGRRRLMLALFKRLKAEDLPENLPKYMLERLKLMPRARSLQNIHFPTRQADLDAAIRRLKFEELFFLQLRLLRIRRRRKDTVRGFAFPVVGDYFRRFFNEKIPFELTGAQKRVIKEVREDLRRGIQMNRLVQGDVGSGKTMVALMCMLIALDNGFQACMMAPTQILAQQHMESLSAYVEGLGIRIAFLSGSIKGKERKQLLADLKAGDIHILVGTHALIEPWVEYRNLGLAVTDEQHRFGVKQRAALWKKNTLAPHILVMTATPIPRTLAMTLYGDLDVSVIDEMPPGRKPVTTMHFTEAKRERAFGLMREEIAKGRQVYIVYPLIEESETLDLKNLTEGYEAIGRAFPKPDYQLSIVHGRMKPAEKDYEMQRFVRRETQIMVATTVIEVGVNVPNASLMIIEETQRFGLSQLHQLRGRVGRGADQSFCILMTGTKLSTDGRERVNTMVRTTDGFEIAEADLRLRGPGNIMGTQQSGLLNLRIADLARDGRILQAAREIANRILDEDPRLEWPQHAPIREYLMSLTEVHQGWSRIS